jgi:hypothetical protein
LRYSFDKAFFSVNLPVSGKAEAAMGRKLLINLI